MKSIRSLQSLSLLGFLLLMAPFYTQCSMKKVKASAEEVMVDTTAVENPLIKVKNPIGEIHINKDSISKNKKNKIPFYQKVYELIDDRNNLSAFELAYVSKEFKISSQGFKEELSNDFKKHKFDGLSLLIRSFSFVFIVLISFSTLILSLLKKVKWINRLTIANLILLLITIICTLFFDPFFETYKQIKWGYYAFTLVQIGICYTSKLQNASPKS